MSGDPGAPVDREGRDGADADGDDAPAADRRGTEPDGFGRRGWVLVAVVVLSVLVVPGVIYAFPAAPADAGLPFLVAMLVLPLLPAALLGATAVWSLTAATGSDERGDAERD